jgi:hypothetical protein
MEDDWFLIHHSSRKVHHCFKMKHPAGASVWKRARAFAALILRGVRPLFHFNSLPAQKVNLMASGVVAHCLPFSKCASNRVRAAAV